MLLNTRPENKKDTLSLQIPTNKLTIFKPEGILGNIPLQSHPCCFMSEKRKAQERRHLSKVPLPAGAEPGPDSGSLMSWYNVLPVGLPRPCIVRSRGRDPSANATVSELTD